MAASPPLLLPLLLACVWGVAAATDTLKQGVSLTGAATLVSSPSGVFEMGFFGPDPKLPSRLYLGIWYRSISPRTVVWVANRAAPATASSPSLTLADNGELRVLDGSSAADAPLLWRSNASTQTAPRGGYKAVVQDTGSLEVRSDDGTLWDSFWHPSDTRLSGMRITVRTPGKGPSEPMRFTSWASETDPSPGRYALGLDPANSGQAYIWRDGNVTIWRSGQWTGHNFVGIPWRPLYLYGFKPANDPNLGAYYTYTASNTSLQRFVVMPHGTDICYMVKKSAQEWETVWMQPSNECEYYATCGANAKCTVVQDGKAKCICLKGFQPKLLDQWNIGNWSQGCVRSPPLGCQSIWGWISFYPKHQVAGFLILAIYGGR